jgi:hypothetical protein
MTSKYAEAKYVKHSFHISAKTTEKNLVYRFWKTYHLTLKTPQQTNGGRVTGQNVLQSKFFQNLTESHKKYKIYSKAILNTVVSQHFQTRHLTCTIKRNYVVENLSSGETGEHKLNEIEYDESASGFYVPPS